MKVRVKCPKCGKELSIGLEHITWTIKCRKCSTRFIPVEDSGLVCPRCGEMTSMLREDAFKELTCLDCGYDFTKPSYRLRMHWKVTVPVAAAVALIVFICLSWSWWGPPGNSRTRANEASAISALRTLSSCQALHVTRYGNYATMSQLAGLGFIDPSLARATSPFGAKSGYYFTITVSQNGWDCTAMPAKPGETGCRSFYIATDGVIYHAPCLSENDPPAPAGRTPLGMEFDWNTEELIPPGAYGW
jgi:ribosomal protein S27E